MSRPGLRPLLGALGVGLTAYGAFLLMSRQHFGDWVEVVAWLAVGVVAHDVLLAPLTVGAGALLVRDVPSALRPSLAVGATVLATTTVLAIPVLGRFGARADNPTLLDRDYVAGWLAVVTLLAVGVVVGALLGRRTRGEGGGRPGSGPRG